MNRHDRLVGLILALQSGRKRSSELAARFEVSRRTILRDLDGLGQIGVPIVAVSGPNGGFEIAEDYFARPLQFTAAEAAILLLGLRTLGSPDQQDFGSARQSVEEKLRSVIPATTLAQVDRESAHVEVVPSSLTDHRPRPVSRLRDAITGEEWLRITYRGEHETGARTVFPRKIFLDRGRWYLRAVSLDAKEERTYRVDRIGQIVAIPPPVEANIALAEATRRARTPPAPLLEALVEVAPALIRRLDDHPDFAGKVSPAAACSQLRFTFPRGELAYFARELFAFGPLARVIAPNELREFVQSLAAATLDRYRNEPAEIGDGPLSPIA